MQAVTKSFMKKFGIFVGFYNKINNSSFSVSNALTRPEIVEAFQKAVITTRTKKNYKYDNSTRKLAMEQFELNEGDKAINNIYRALKNQEYPVSRSDLAKLTGYRLSTICSQIHNLKKNGLVQVVGIKLDLETTMKVQTLSVSKLDQ